MKRALIWQVAVGVLVVFAAGVATGMFVGARKAHDVLIIKHQGRMGERMREHLTRELELTPEQLEKISPVIDETTKKLQQIRMESGRRVSETMQQSRQQVAPYLTPEQREKLDRMKLRHRRIFRRRGFPPPPPHEAHDHGADQH